MTQVRVAFNTTFTTNPYRQVIFRSAGGRDKQLDYVLIDKMNRKYCDDVIHMKSDHRSVVTHFRFPCKKRLPKRKWHEK